MYSVLKNLGQNGDPYPTARKPGGLPITLEDMELDTLQAFREPRLQPQQTVISSDASGRHPTKCGAMYSKGAPLSPGLLNISCRLGGDNVFLGRQIPF